MQPPPPAAAFRASHALEHLGDRALAAVEVRQVDDREHPITPTLRVHAVHCEAEASQRMKRAGEDRGRLSAGGSVGSHHSETKGVYPDFRNSRRRIAQALDFPSVVLPRSAPQGDQSCWLQNNRRGHPGRRLVGQAHLQPLE